MNRKRNLQENMEEAEDLDNHRGKTMKTEMNGAEESERSGDEPIQEPHLSDNRRILNHDQNVRDVEDIPNPREYDHVSYVRLPEDYPVSIPSGRSELDSSVLNDHWVLSVNPPSEDSNLHEEDKDENSEMDEAEQREITDESDQESIQEHGNEGEGFKDLNETASDDSDNKSDSINLQHFLDEDDRAAPKESRQKLSKRKSKNQYQEKMFETEDEQCDIDVLSSTALSALECCNEVYERIKEERLIVEGPLQIEQHFRATHLRLIKLLYGNHGLDVLEILRNDPTEALPVIIKRLKQKYDEWCEYRSENKKVWAQVYAENHFNALRHPS